MSTIRTTTKDESIKLAKLLREKLQRQQLPVHQVLLFGSTVKGTQHQWSDIDVAIICDRFRPTRHEENMAVRKARREIDVRISPICLHPEDLQNKFWLLPQEVQQHGIPV